MQNNRYFHSPSIFIYLFFIFIYLFLFFLILFYKKKKKILFDNNGLNFICSTIEGFNAVTSVLSSIVQKIDKEKDSARLLKHIIRCYHRLTDNPGAKDLLKSHIPPQLKDLSNILDNSTKKILNQLLSSLGI